LAGPLFLGRDREESTEWLFSSAGRKLSRVNTQANAINSTDLAWSRLVRHQALASAFLCTRSGSQATSAVVRGGGYVATVQPAVKRGATIPLIKWSLIEIVAGRSEVAIPPSRDFELSRVLSLTETPCGALTVLHDNREMGGLSSSVIVMAKVLAAPAGTVVRSELTIPVGRRLHQMCGHFPTEPAPGGSRRPREELPAGPRRPAQPPASG